MERDRVRYCAYCSRPFFDERPSKKQKYCGSACYHRATEKPLAQKLWGKVLKTPKCWVFTGRRNTHGYGRLVISAGRRGPEIYTHRLSWELHFGPIPDDKHVLHRCDNPPCVRPEHLYLGTDEDNRRDAVERGRIAHGVRHWHARLNLEAVLAIRKAAGSMTYAQIAPQWGIRVATVGKIVRRELWRHV
jgi:hypothetical protein